MGWALDSFAGDFRKTIESTRLFLSSSFSLYLGRKIYYIEISISAHNLHINFRAEVFVSPTTERGKLEQNSAYSPTRLEDHR
jgi:hypothetical protein